MIIYNDHIWLLEKCMNGLLLEIWNVIQYINILKEKNNVISIYVEKTIDIISCKLMKIFLLCQEWKRTF